MLVNFQSVLDNRSSSVLDLSIIKSLKSSIRLLENFSSYECCRLISRPFHKCKFSQFRSYESSPLRCSVNVEILTLLVLVHAVNILSSCLAYVSKVDTLQYYETTEIKQSSCHIQFSEENASASLNPFTVWYFTATVKISYTRNTRIAHSTGL